MLFTVVFVICSSVSMYYTAEKAALSIQLESNEKTLEQINYNINTMNELVHSMAVSLFWDPELMPLMLNREIEVIELLKKLRKLDSAVNTTAFLHSIVVYNQYTEQFFSGGVKGFQNADSAAAKNMSAFMRQGQFNRMTLTPIGFNDDTPGIDAFAYIIFDSIEPMYQNQSAMILNVKPEWLFNHIQVVNQLAMESHIFLINEKGRILSTNQQEDNSRGDVSEFFSMNMDKLSLEKGYFKELIGQEQNLISYAKTEISDIYVVTIQPYTAMLGQIQQMRTNSLYITGSFILLSLLLSIWLAHKLYQPVENLIKLVRHGPGPGEHPTASDELTYLSNMYRSIKENLHQAREEQQNKQKVLQSYYIRKLVTDSSSFSNDEFTALASEHKLHIDPENLVMALLAIDHNGRFPDHTTEHERKLLHFAILNIAEEIISRQYRCVTADMRNHQLVILISAGSMEPDRNGHLLSLIKDIQQVVNQFYKITVSAALGQKIGSYKQITDQFRLVQEFMLYRVIYGNQSIITCQMVKDNMDNASCNFPPELERRLAEGLKSGDLFLYEDAVQKSFDYIQTLNYDFIMYSLIHMMISIKHSVREMNNHRVRPIHADINGTSQKMTQIHSLERARQLFLELFHQILEGQRQNREDRGDILIDTVKEYIQENYMDPNLSLQGIAGMMKITADHLGRLFKRSEGGSVADYINEVRLNHVEHLLLSKNLSIREIMEQVGYMNQSSFFKVFKKRFGTTPKEYRLKKSLEE